MKNALLFSSILLLCNFNLSSATLTVCASGCDFTTIAAAVAAATAGDVIEIQDPIHTEAAITIDRSLTIQGLGQAATVVQAAASQAAAEDGIFFVDPGLTVTFQDMTLQNGNALVSGVSAQVDGGAVSIACNPSTSASFLRVTITNNRANDDGGGVYISGNNGTVTFTDCVISNNEANISLNQADGGGIYNIGASTLTVTRSTISGNTAGDDGGGVFIFENGSVNQFINCTIYNNSAGGAGRVVEGGGMRLDGNMSTSYSLINCTIVDNTVTTAATREGAGVFWSGGSLELINSIVANNTNATDGNDVIEVTAGTLTMTTSLVEDCSGCSVAPTFTTDPNLASVAFCGESQSFLYPQVPSDALGNGTAPGGNIPADDICGSARGASNNLGSIGDIPLPVELISFEVKAIDLGHLLIWQTASEVNNYGFFTERSADGFNWEEIGFVEGSGTKSTLTNYSYTDRNPLSGINFYRLRQVDIDGVIDYSNTVEIFFGAGSEIIVYPNPTQGLVEIGGLDNEEVTIIVLDRIGRKVLEKRTSERTIDITAFPTGLYYLTVETENEIFNKHFIKTN